MAKVFKKFANTMARRMVKSELRRQAGKSPSDAFRDAWKRLLSHPLYCLFIRTNERPAREGMQLKGKTFELLSGGIPNFFHVGRIKISDDLKKAIEGGEALLAVHLHEGHRFIERPFLERGRALTRIAADPPRYVDMLRRLGMDVSRVHAIKDDVLSLAHLLKAVRNKHILCMTLDYKDARGRRTYINPAIFAFAYRSKIPIFFCKSHVDEHGNPEIISDGPHVDVEPIACAEKFLDFFNSAGNSRVSMRIKRYTEHEDWEINERYGAEKTADRLSLPLD